MGLKRVSWVRRYQRQCRALRPLGHQGYRLRSYKKDPPLCSGYSPALAALKAQPIIWYFAVLFGRLLSFACAIHMYSPRRWQGPVGPPWCVSVLPMGAPRSCSGSVVRCSCSCLPACRAPYRALFRGSCGRCACVTVLSLAVRMVRAARLLLWCRDIPSGVATWAWRNTSVPAGRGSAWPRVASLWSLACPGWGFGGHEYRAVLQPSSRFLTLLAFCGECVPCTILAGYMCRIPPSVPAV